MYEENVTERIPKDGRFLLIKQWGFGFWSDMHDVWGKLLLAEITNRRPIVFWGEDSLYSVGENNNSFEQYFLPVSDCSLGDVVNDKYTYFPPVWNFSNIFHTDPKRFLMVYRDVPSFINSNANVLVSDHYNFINEFMPWIKEGHPAHGLNADDVYRYIHNKYIKLQPDIAKEIDEFYHTHMETGPILAVHICGSLPNISASHLNEINSEYPHEIDCYLKDNPSARIFLLTENESILEQYRQRYGDILIYTDCNRKMVDGFYPVLQVFPDRRRKGIEIIKDTYLASKCDYFIGNGGSNVSIAIIRLKTWGNGWFKALWKPLPPGKYT